MTEPIHLEHDWFPRPLPANVVIGDRSWCYSSYAFIHCRSERPCAVRIGSDTGIYHTSFFELGTDGEVVIGNYCAIVGAIINTNRRVVIGDYSFVAHGVVFADHVAGVPHAMDVNAAATEASTDPGIIVGENCWIGAHAVLLSGARIGDGAIVGAAAVVDFDVPPNSIVAGNPARIVR